MSIDITHVNSCSFGTSVILGVQGGPLTQIFNNGIRLSPHSIFLYRNSLG